MAILDRVDWDSLDILVGIQQRNRERHAPAVSLFRWWARRPHAVAGAILDAARAEFGTDRYVVADPFSGGGTVAFEAVRRGMAVYAQDLYAWPSFCLATALMPTDPREFAAGVRALLEKLDAQRRPYWHQEGANTWETTHVLRVRKISCPNCDTEVYLFRDPFLSLSSRKSGESNGFFGCAACGSASQRRVDVARFRCSRCDRKWPTRVGGSNAELRQCPHCEETIDYSQAFTTAPRWSAVLLQERKLGHSEKPGSVLRPVQEGDVVDDLSESPVEQALQLPIPPGVETNHLRAFGFQRWSDLYPRRQLQTLLAAARDVGTLTFTDEVRQRLLMSVLGACEMAGFICRWERYHPKAIEAIANHRYARTTVVVETNLLSPIGRGTIPRRLQAAEKALTWLWREGAVPKQIRAASSDGRRRHLSTGALVVTGSSTRQVLTGGAARLIFTDPPYHDDVQYGELAQLFHAWMAMSMQTPAPNERAEAVPNAVRGTNTKHYEDLVAACLAESRRTLQRDGRLVLTFHNNDLNAWAALANALARAGFVVVGLATVSAENPMDHSKRGKRVFLCDLVIECIQRSVHRSDKSAPTVRGVVSSEERRNLVAVGLAVAEKVNTRTPEELKELYRHYLGEWESKEVLIM
jgi:putative DNA methylase